MVFTLGPYAELGLFVAGWWLFCASLVVACIVAGWIGQRIARRSGRQCPDCDYRGKPGVVAIHHALDHEREH